MAGTNVDSARQKSAGDEMVSAEFLPKQDRRELNSPATIHWLSSSINGKRTARTGSPVKQLSEL
jgi:hypothetical protein